MFFTAPETKGKTLEEMDDVFDTGVPAWKTVKSGSRLDELTRDIETGNLKVYAPGGTQREHVETTQVETKAGAVFEVDRT